MKLWINGEEKAITRLSNLKQLLEALQIDPKTVVVERNETVVSCEDLTRVPLMDGDKVEIVQFVGGGAPKKKSTSRKKKSPSGIRTSKAKNLVIVESPAKAKTINKFLGEDFQVEASMGHVRDLPKSKMAIDVKNNFEPEYITIVKARKTVKHLKQQAKGKEKIFLAPDPDREGEAISWHLSYIFNENSEKNNDGDVMVHRVVFNEITKDAVCQAFEKPRQIEMNLVNAQQARRIMDRLVGYELSPLLWRKVGRGLSAGRVQSVALRFVVDREREIKKFVPVEYWTIDAKLSKEEGPESGKIFVSRLEKKGEEKLELKNKAQTAAIREEILSLPFKVASVDKRQRQRRPQAPYTTSKLQQEAYNRLRFPAAKTMRIAQNLYEGVELGDQGSVGLITYMRTDSVNVAATAQKEAAAYVKEKYDASYLPETPPVYKSKKGAQEAHEAIRPSSVRRTPDSIKSYLSDDEFKLYDLIWRKFVSSQMTPALDEQVSIIISAGEKYFFKTTGKRNLFPGFGIIFETAKSAKASKADSENEKEDSEELEVSEELPDLQAGQALKLHELLGEQHFTKPPARFNDASLVKALEEEGIGRPSTYAPIIYTLVSRDYVERQGGALVPTELGETVIDLLVKYFANILDARFTASMEEELDKIEEGNLDWVSVVKDFYSPFEADLEVARKEMKNIKQEAVPTEYLCDVCGKGMVIKWGRFGKFLACSGFPECRYTRSIPTGFRCPETDCGGDLVKRMSKKRRTFYGCSNYPKCRYVTNKLPRKDEAVNEDDKISDYDRETLGP